MYNENLREENSSNIRSTKKICVPHILRKNNLSYATVFWEFFVNYISVARCLSSKTQHTVYNVPHDNWGGQGLLTSMHTKSNVGISRTLISPCRTCNAERPSVLLSVNITGAMNKFNQYHCQHNYRY